MARSKTHAASETPTTAGNTAAPVGSDYVVDSAVGSSALEPNAKVRGDKATGSLSSPGEWATMLRTNIAAALGAQSLLATLQGAVHDVSAHELCRPEIVEYVRSLLFERMAKPFSGYTEQIFKAALFGFSANELTTKHIDGKWYLADIAWRRPQTIDLNSVKRNPDTGYIECTQNWYDSSGRMKSAKYSGPGVEGKGWIWWIVFGGGSLLGEPLLRPIYSDYEEGQEAKRMRRIGIQKATMGSPTIMMRESAGTEGKRGSPSRTDIETTTEQVARQRTTENTALAMPGWVESIENPFTDPEAVAACTSVINDTAVKILLGFFAAHFARGLLASFGTNAASESDSQGARNIRRYFLDWLKIQVQPLINYFVDLNFGPQAYYPELVSQYVEEMPIAERVAALSAGVSSGLYKPTRGDRDEFRALLRVATAEPEEEIGAVDAQLLNGAQISAVVQIMGAVSLGQMSRDSAVALLIAGIGLPEDVATRIVGQQAPVPPVPPAPPAPPVPEKDDTEHEAMTACSCGQVHKFADGVRLPPRPGGQEQYTGPNGRPLGKLEQTVAWGQIEFALKNFERDLAAVLRSQQALAADHMLQQIYSGEWVNAQELARFIGDQAIPESLRSMVRDAVARKMLEIADSAAKEVDDEYTAQTGKAVPATDDLPWVEAQDFVEIRAGTVADELIQDAKTQLVTMALAVTAPTREEVLSIMDKARRELSAGGIEKIPPLVTSEVYARARLEEAKAIEAMSGDDIEAIYYSAVLDSETCEYCEAADSQHGENGEPIVPGSPQEVEFMPPYQKCLGGVRCRCMFVYKYRSES